MIIRMKPKSNHFEISFSCPHFKRDNVDNDGIERLRAEISKWEGLAPKGSPVYKAAIDPIRKQIRRSTVGYCTHFPDEECRLFANNDDPGKPLYDGGGHCVKRALEDIGKSILVAINKDQLTVSVT